MSEKKGVRIESEGVVRLKKKWLKRQKVNFESGISKGTLGDKEVIENSAT